MQKYKNRGQVNYSNPKALNLIKKHANVHTPTSKDVYSSHLMFSKEKVPSSIITDLNQIKRMNPTQEVSKHDHNSQAVATSRCKREDIHY